MYRRPFPPADTRPRAPATDWPTPPAIGRYEMPEGGRAAAPVIRFVAQALVLSTAGLMLAQAVRWVWPAGCVLLFGVTAVALLAGAGLKWLWGDRAGQVPVLTAATLLGGAAWVLGSLAGETTLGGMLLVGFGAVAVMHLAFVARWADAVAMWQDWKGTLALAAGALALLLAGLLPPSFGVARVAYAVALVADIAFLTAATVVYAGYVLANPAQPQSVIADAAARWGRLAWWLMNLAGCACGVVVAIAIAFPEPTPETPAVLLHAIARPGAAADAPADSTWVGLLPYAAAVCGVAVPFFAASYGGVCWRAFLVWMLYGAGEPPMPGVYRPGGLLGSVRVRQAMVTGLVALNVLMFRAAAPLDLVLPAVLGRSQGSPEPDTQFRIAVWLFAASLALPVFVPALLWPPLFGRDLRALHNEVEAAPPADLYPDGPDVGRPTPA